jgi:GntR family transcriptional regulator, transcriptional repressor for pyruvate dehydrogenase complex
MTDLTLTPPHRSTLVGDIVQQLLEQIQTGKLQAGDRLPTERQLMEMLNVSRASVREALQTLTGMGVIEARVGEGTFVKAMKPHWALELELRQMARTVQRQDRLHLLHARSVVEKGTIELAIANGAAQQLEKIRAATRAWVEACTPEDIKLGLHDQIHLTIAEATGNPLLVLVLQTLLEALPAAVRNHGIVGKDGARDQAALQQELDLHVQLTDAIVRRDLTAALAAFAAHQVQESRLIQQYYNDEEPATVSPHQATTTSGTDEPGPYLA